VVGANGSAVDHPDVAVVRGGDGMHQPFNPGDLAAQALVAWQLSIARA
jgi:hypothetical protein